MLLQQYITTPTSLAWKTSVEQQPFNMYELEVWILYILKFDSESTLCIRKV